MDGKALAARIRAEVAREVAAFPRPIGLATVLVGNDPASDVYIRMTHKATLEVGIAARDLRLPAETTEKALLELVAELNADDAIDGILVQLPLPGQIDEGRVIRAVDPVKDVDGFHPVNAGLLLAGTPAHVPGTPLGVLALLDEYDVELEGANAVVIGRSDIVGKPAALLLLHRHSTVTICHSRTRDLAAEVSRADVIVAAVGVPGIVTAAMVKEAARPSRSKAATLAYMKNSWRAVVVGLRLILETAFQRLQVLSVGYFEASACLNASRKTSGGWAPGNVIVPLMMKKRLQISS